MADSVNTLKPQGVPGLAVVLTILLLLQFGAGLWSSPEYIQKDFGLGMYIVLLVTLSFTVASWYFTFRAMLEHADGKDLVLKFKINAWVWVVGLLTWSFA